FTASGATLVDNGEESTDIIFIITDDSGELTFTLEIPPEGLTGYGEDSRGTDDKMEHIVEDIRSIDWPSTNRPTEWSFVEDGDDLKITIDLSKIDENFPMEWEIEFPQTEAGSGKIETNDWSSHQRRQTEEEGETDPGEEFSAPDGRGEVYGGDNPATTTVRLMKVDIVSTPLVLYANSRADVPISFSIYPEGLIELNDIADIDLKIEIDGVSHDLDVKVENDIVEGNEADDSSPTGDLFTLLVPENEYNSIRVNGKRSEDVKYEFELSLNYNQNNFDVVIEKELTGFADFRVFCVEIGESKEISSSFFNSTVWKDAEEGWQVAGSIGEPLSFQNPNMIATTRQYGKPNDGYGLYARLSDGPLNGTGGDVVKYRNGVWHKQRGLYFIVYYGRKDVDGRNVIDVSKDTGTYNVSAWGGNSSFYAEVKTGNNEEKDLAGFGLSTLGLAFSAIPPFKPVSFTIALASFTWSSIGFVSTDESAAIYSDNYIIRNDLNGDPLTGADRQTITSTSGFSPSSSDSQTYTPDGQDGLLDYKDKSAKALHTIYAYNSSSVVVTNKSIWRNLWWTDVWGKLEFDPGENKVEIDWVD
ncbi:MAG: hypothetical protein LAT55_13245, partial [Opitutales bacterium]|nr:hypothetical protein [Opitutales bacterium]